LLWPADTPRPPRNDKRWLGDSLANLGVEELVKAFTPNFHHQRHSRDLLLELCADPRVIEHRQATVEDLLRNPALTAQLEALLPELAELHTPSFRSTQESAFYQTVWRLAELETFVACVRQLSATLEGAGALIRSSGLQRLRAHLAEWQRDAAFQSLAAQLPELVSKIRGVQSITVGINLDSHLRPVAATLLSVNRHRFKNQSLLGQLLPDEDVAGIAPLHVVKRDVYNRPAENAELRLSPLYRDLEQVLANIARPIAEALAKYRSVNVRVLQDLEPELAFFVCGARFVERLRASGLPFCRPTVLDGAARITELRGFFNVLLATRLQADGAAKNLSDAVIGNDIALEDSGRLAILTGPNRGGKTTFTQALGLAQLLFQAGLPVPGEAARLSPVDAIYVHFTAEEKFQLGAGRLGEEAQRVSEIFQHATRHSLILFNESFSSTTPGEGLYLVLDVVRGLRLLGARGVFVTHFLELAERADQLNDSPGDSRVFSLVAGVLESPDRDAATRTYKIQPGPPLGTSYAHEIAVKHGISYDQISEMLRSCGKLNG
jgi:DNA mismatch repair ATPase MutS